MRLITSSATIAALALLTACSGSSLGPTVSARTAPVWSEHASLVPVELRPGGFEATIHRITASPDRKRRRPKAGIYVGEFTGSSILGYANPNTNNNPPICFVRPVSYAQGIAVDGAGNLIVPDDGTNSVIVFHGPRMCGSKIGSAHDPYGQAVDAASANAATGTIVVGNEFDNSGTPGSISLCTLNGGCTTNLTNPAMYEVAGVALANNGDCWASAANASGTATLTYFKHCRGSGQQATGFENSYYGGLDIDTLGRLVSVSYYDAKLYVYLGCNPGCQLVDGPFALHGQSLFGHLDKYSQNFVAGDYQFGQIDVYLYYTFGRLTYDYSFNNGLSPSQSLEGAAFNPRSKQ